MSLLCDEDSEEETFSFDDIRPQIRALSVESADDRFSMNDDLPEPRVAAWRNNLVASSQRRNLLFVAYRTEIWVWVPSGSSQKLGSAPVMIIKPQMKCPRATGYIDRNVPHTINNILIDDLGRDEVLLLATDSGNVCGYHVEAIHGAIAQCASRNDKRPFSGSEVSPFFVEHVGESAWGLAIHKYARLIAVSANTGYITVFALALANPTSRDENDESQAPANQEPERLDDTWVKIDRNEDLLRLKASQSSTTNYRSRNLRLTYKGHLDNIPSVSFANFDLDANGEWMVSTDITNRVHIWRLWEDLTPLRIYYPGHPLNNPPERGWSVITLDPRSFKPNQTSEDACGCDPGAQVIEGRAILDVSKSIESIYDTSQLLYHRPSVDRRCLPVDDDGEEHALANEIFSHPLPSKSKTYGLSDNPEHESGEDHIENESNLSDDGLSDDGDLVMTGMCISGAIEEKSPISTLFDEGNQHYQVEHPLHYDPIGIEQTHWQFDYLKTHAVHPHSPSCFPVIHFSEHHISLAPYPLDSQYHLICKNPLYQSLSMNSDFEVSFHCDRFNMVKYVRELGIIVAASQKGRVAIISLTWHQEVGFAFRLDWIVPFSTQEARDGSGRPMMPLLGLAVSPMPGFENPPDVPFIPRGVDLNDWLTFNYRIFDPDSLSEDGSPSTPPSHLHPQPSSQSTSDTPQSPDHSPTLAELHAQASVSFRPHERWHGWHPSRHYRLMLYYYDHTVMNYEFWHDWRT